MKLQDKDEEMNPIEKLKKDIEDNERKGPKRQPNRERVEKIEEQMNQ